MLESVRKSTQYRAINNKSTLKNGIFCPGSYCLQKNSACGERGLIFVLILTLGLPLKSPKNQLARANFSEGLREKLERGFIGGVLLIVR